MESDEFSAGRKSRLEVDLEFALDVDGALESDANRNNDFWIAYIQAAFQGSIDEDNDPNDERLTQAGGVTPELNGRGSFVFIESIFDLQTASRSV